MQVQFSCCGSLAKIQSISLCLCSVMACRPLLQRMELSLPHSAGCQRHCMSAEGPTSLMDCCRSGSSSSGRSSLFASAAHSSAICKTPASRQGPWADRQMASRACDLHRHYLAFLPCCCHNCCCLTPCSEAQLTCSVTGCEWAGQADIRTAKGARMTWRSEICEDILQHFSMCQAPALL